MGGDAGEDPAAVEGFSIIAISYYLLGILKVALESSEHAGLHLSPLVMLVSIPIVIVAVALMRTSRTLSNGMGVDQP